MEYEIIPLSFQSAYLETLNLFMCFLERIFTIISAILENSAAIANEPGTVEPIDFFVVDFLISFVFVILYDFDIRSTSLKCFKQ